MRHPVNRRRVAGLCAALGFWLCGLGPALAGIFSTDCIVEYLCCDWGPALTLPIKTNAVAQFNDAEDEVYFLKQVTSGSREKANIYLCKMKADGSAKTEIKELWKNPNYSIDTQAQSTWMDVNRKMRKVALSITYGGSDVTGLWTVNLDGSGLKHLITPALVGGHQQHLDSPSWTPDGEWIVYREETDGMHLMKCDKNGNNILRYQFDDEASQPRISPDGKKIVFKLFSHTKGGLWIMNIDGSDAHPIPEPDDERTGRHHGSYPAWSPSGDKLFYIGISCRIIDSTSGKALALQVGHSGWPHWGRLGLIGFNVRGIDFTDIELKESKSLTGAGLANGRDQETGTGKW